MRLRGSARRPLFCWPRRRSACVSTTQRSPHRRWRHGQSRASGEGAPGAATVPPGAWWSEKPNKWGNGDLLGASEDGRRRPEAGHGRGWARLSEAPRENLVPEWPLNARVDGRQPGERNGTRGGPRGDECRGTEAHLLWRAFQIYPGGFPSIWLLSGVSYCKAD